MPDRDPGFLQRTRVVVGLGAFNEISRYYELLGMRRVVVLMDSALANGPLADRVRNLLPRATIISMAPGEPTTDTVEAAAIRISSADADGVVAIGGGSTLDTAKVARCLGDGGLRAIREGRAPQRHPPLIAVPTTAGTGAEMGAGAIVYANDVDDKILVRHGDFAADIALADGELTFTLPPHVTAFTGCDALAQAILAYVAAGWDAVSGQSALRAIRLVLAALPRAVAEPSDPSARGDMMLGSVLSAMAMYNAPTTYSAEHIFAEPLGARLKVHHGHLVAVFLPLVLEANSAPLTGVYAEIAREAGLAASEVPASDAAAELVRAVRELVRSLGIPPLKDVVSDYPLDELADRCERHPDFAQNPVPLGRDDTMRILQMAYNGQ